MFGPNSRATFDGRTFHHRGSDYHALLYDVIDLLHEKCSIPRTYDLLLLSGSGTLANEAVIASARPGGWSVFVEGEFSQRLVSLALAYKKLGEGGETLHWAAVQYETQNAARSPLQRWPDTGGVSFMDCVSGFPYYPAPLVDVWTTVTSKQLGALPVMSVVAVKKTAWGVFESPERYSYLNLARYRHSQAVKRESPHTPSIALLADTLAVLQQFDVQELRGRVDFHRWLLVQHFKDSAHGEGPVLWVDRDRISHEMAVEWGLYPHPHGWQFFLYSGTDQEYCDFIRAQER